MMFILSHYQINKLIYLPVGVRDSGFQYQTIELFKGKKFNCSSRRAADINFIQEFNVSCRWKPVKALSDVIQLLQQPRVRGISSVTDIIF